MNAPKRSAQRAEPDEPYGPNTAVLLRFYDRLGTLTFDDLSVAVQRWRETVAPTWLAAEHASSSAVRTTGRALQRDLALESLYQVFERWRWSLPGVHATSTYVTAQYLASAALIALLVRDVMVPGQVAMLYRPFETLIPLGELDESLEPSCSDGDCEPD